MIYWLVQSTGAHPVLERGQPPPGLLSASELEHFHALRTPKRRHDWLLGRWTAKHLVQRFLVETTSQRMALDSIEIKNEEDGSPFVELHEQHPTHHLARHATSTRRRLAACLTISHCEEWAFCAVTTQVIGVDIERVRPRAWNFVETFFTDAEARQVQAAAPVWGDTLTTAIWSAKEAALKAVKLGLTVDTRRVECQFDLDQPAEGVWKSFQVTFTPAAPASAVMHGWWSLRGGFVLTIIGPDEITM
ncbi:4'-phosphopantetheinyl transferase family protein [Candidatus Amarolinea aalborgensis]|uniref:4'-phosphopantetheinyl transferase family protein n=1 Tax=Candidatus Amarolinea aalborgensis TaxID=2249329 RepID=UPI003BF99232